MPLKMALTGSVGGKRKEERRAIEAVRLAELLKLFRRCLFTQDRDCRVAGHEFD